MGSSSKRDKTRSTVTSNGPRSSKRYETTTNGYSESKSKEGTSASGTGTGYTSSGYENITSSSSFPSGGYDNDNENDPSYYNDPSSYPQDGRYSKYSKYSEKSGYKRDTMPSSSYKRKSMGSCKNKKASAAQTDKGNETKHYPLKKSWFPPPCCPPFCFQPRPLQIIIDRFIPPIPNKNSCKKGTDKGDGPRQSTETHSSDRTVETIQSTGPGKPRVVCVFKNPNEPFCPINLHSSLWREGCDPSPYSASFPAFHNCTFYHFSGKENKKRDSTRASSNHSPSKRRSSKRYSNPSGAHYSNASSGSWSGTSNNDSSSHSSSGSFYSKSDSNSNEYSDDSSYSHSPSGSGSGSTSNLNPHSSYRNYSKGSSQYKSSSYNYSSRN